MLYNLNELYLKFFEQIIDLRYLIYWIQCITDLNFWLGLFLFFFVQYILLLT